MKNSPKITKIFPASKSQWMTFCKESPVATFFHTPLWADAFQEHSPNRLESCSSFFEFDDGMLILLPGVTKKMLGGVLRVVLSMPGGTPGGWVYKKEPGQGHYTAMLQQLNNYRDLLMRENPVDKIMSLTDLPGWEYDFTQIIDLSPGYKAVFAGAGCNHRNAVRNAEKMEIELEEAEDLNSWKEYFNLYEKSIERWKKYGKFTGVKYNFGLFQFFHKMDSSYRKLFIARVEGKAIAGILCFYWNSHCVVWHGAGRYDYFRYRPNNFLYNHAIKHASDSGLRWFDCNPSSGIKGVIDFKNSLGAHVVRSRIINKKSALRRTADVLRMLNFGRKK